MPWTVHSLCINLLSLSITSSDLINPEIVHFPPPLPTSLHVYTFCFMWLPECQNGQVLYNIDCRYVESYEHILNINFLVNSSLFISLTWCFAGMSWRASGHWRDTGTLSTYWWDWLRLLVLQNSGSGWFPNLLVHHTRYRMYNCTEQLSLRSWELCT